MLVLMLVPTFLMLFIYFSSQKKGVHPQRVALMANIVFKNLGSEFTIPQVMFSGPKFRFKGRL